MSELVNGFDASIVDEKVLKVGPAKIDIAYQRLGNRDAPIVLLIMGIAAQSIAWPDAFCHQLVDRGLQLIRFDNRDIGLSTHLTDAPPPDLPAALAGDLSSVSYTLSDMAADAVGLMDALGFNRAHMVGASMGGAIAQTMAIEHPSRVRSLTSMMSTTGNMAVGQASPAVLREVFGGPPAVTRDDVVQQTLRALRAVGSPGYPATSSEAAARAGRAYDRRYDPIGIARQAIASVASGNRTRRPATSRRSYARHSRPRRPHVRRQRRASHGRSHPRRGSHPDRGNGTRPGAGFATPTGGAHRGICVARGTQRRSLDALRPFRLVGIAASCQQEFWLLLGHGLVEHAANFIEIHAGTCPSQTVHVIKQRNIALEGSQGTEEQREFSLSHQGIGQRSWVEHITCQSETTPGWIRCGLNLTQHCSCRFSLPSREDPGSHRAESPTSAR